MTPYTIRLRIILARGTKVTTVTPDIVRQPKWPTVLVRFIVHGRAQLHSHQPAPLPNIERACLRSYNPITEFVIRFWANLHNATEGRAVALRFPMPRAPPKYHVSGRLDWEIPRTILGDSGERGNGGAVCVVGAGSEKKNASR